MFMVVFASIVFSNSQEEHGYSSRSFHACSLAFFPEACSDA
jgi:hypothetical protein